jgi:GNAT superfamily N-acetyltransferase
MTGTPELSDQMARYFSHVDHVDHEKLVALPSRRSRTIVGVARYIRHRDQPTDAELAVTVADQWHDRGLGTALVALLSERARAAGVDRFTVDILADNDAVRALVTSAGGGISLQDEPVASGRIELRPVLVPLGNPVPEPALRAVFDLDGGR